MMRSKPFMGDYLPQDAPDVSPIADALFSQPHFGGTRKKILPVIVTVDELPPSDYPKPYNPQHVVDGVVVEERHEEHNDGANGYDDGDDIEEDDGQPSEYDEWQDYMGGDDWDHGQYDDCGW